MHEYSLAQNLIELLREEREKRGCEKILKVFLEIGKLSGAEPLLLKEAFEILKKENEFKDTELILEIIEPEVICESCGKIFSPFIFPFECPYCKNFGGKIIKGDKIFIKSLEMLK